MNDSELTHMEFIASQYSARERRRLIRARQLIMLALCAAAFAGGVVLRLTMGVW